MKFSIRKGHTGTIRRVWSDDKKILWGVVGTVADLLKEGILERADYPGETWCFINAPDNGLPVRFGSTREEATAHIPIPKEG